MIEQQDIDRLQAALGEKFEQAELGLRRAEKDVRQAADHLREQGPLFEPTTRAGRVAFYGVIAASLVGTFLLGMAFG